ncbi:MAG: FIVAR domain-containing protein, partial [Clostridium sp.]|nr:FIVAR domain-containing protein [Clostridium sp.]
DSSNNLYTIRENGIVYDSNGNPTEYKVTENNMDLYKGENKVDNVMTSTSPLKVLGTSFLSLIYSDDDGVTWSDPVDLNKDVKVDWMRFLGTGPGVGMQVKNGDHAGRLVFPVYLTNSSGFQSSAVIYSDDNGKSWNIGETANDGRDLGNGEFGDAEHMTSGLQLTESQVVEMPNGQLKMFMRNTGAYVRIATSFDGGATWDSDVYEDLNLREPYCQLSVINYSRKIDGKDAIIFANPDSGSRSNGTVKVGLINQNGTHENGEPKYTFDWKYKKVVKPGYYAYSCLTELPDGNIGLFYEGTPTTSMSYMEMGIDYLKYNVADSIEPAAIKSVNILDEDNKYLPGENIKLKIAFNQTVSLVGDNNLTVNIGGKDVTLTLVPEENSTEFTFIGTLPEDIEAGEYGVVLNANPNTKILNTLGHELILNENKNLDIVVNIERNEENEEVNKDALKISIDYAEKLKVSGELEDVIPIVVKEFNEALELAKGVYEDKNASEAEVNTAFMRLANVIHMLEFKKGDKEALEQFIIMAEALNPKVYTSSSWEAMQLELENAKSVFNNENAMENEVMEATNKLKLAIDNLEAIKINKSALQKLVDIILALDEIQYIPSTWAPMATQLENANNILVNADATQEKVDESYNSLLRSYLQLRLKADKSKLDDLINKVKNMDLSKYSSKDIARINAELENAIKVSNNEGSTQKEVNEATERLRTVVNEVASNNDTGTKPDDGSESGTSSGDGSIGSGSDASGSESSSSGTTGKGSNGSKLPNTGGVQTGIFGVISALAGVSLFRKRKNKKDL